VKEAKTPDGQEAANKTPDQEDRELEALMGTVLARGKQEVEVEDRLLLPRSHPWEA